MAMDRSDGQKRGDEALKIAEEAQEEARQKGHTMEGQGPQKSNLASDEGQEHNLSGGGSMSRRSG